MQFLLTKMQDIYATAEVCLPRSNGKQCKRLEPDLNDIFVKSKDYCELQWAWEGWRNETGKKMRGLFMSYSLLENEAAQANGFENAKMLWTRSFTYDDPSYFEQVEKAWNDVKPLYQELHAYVRRKLMERYSGFENQFPNSRHIPAHLLGNMWAQVWQDLYDLVIPYPEAASINLDQLLTDNVSPSLFLI